MITEEQRLLLNQYKDKAYINAILAEESNNYYQFIKNIINIPLIICNSVMVCINSMITDQDTLKILNIILNSSTGLILGLISNFKIYEKINQYHQLYIKYNKLSILIDTKITNELDTIGNDFIEGIINDYNNVLEQQDYPYPSVIRKRIKKQYEEKMTLPLSLSADIVECKSQCCSQV
jgi:hypothetical protein